MQKAAAPSAELPTPVIETVLTLAGDGKGCPSSASEPTNSRPFFRNSSTSA
jgi:hypothetical protein